MRFPAKCLPFEVIQKGTGAIESHGVIIASK